LAHELGHYLGIHHTHRGLYNSKQDAQTAFADNAYRRSTFDGDGIDTPEDPFIWFNDCNTSAKDVTLTKPPPFGSNPIPVNFSLPRNNVMSYYLDPVQTITPRQATIENSSIPAGPHFSIGARFQLIADHSGKCLDIGGGNMADDAAAVQWDCLGANQLNQHWRLIPVGADQVQIAAGHSNKCLEVRGGSTANGTFVVQMPCSDTPPSRQLWRLIRDGINNIVGVRPSHTTGKCLDVGGVSPHNGAVVVQWDCFGTTQRNQHWRIRPVEPEIQVIANHTGKCLDVAGAGLGNGVDVVQHMCFGANAGQQLWRFVEISQGRYNLVAKHSNRCLDVDGVGKHPTANVSQWDCLGPMQTNQVWRLVHARADLFHLIADHSGHCLDVDITNVPRGGIDDGTNVIQEICGGTNQFNQLWRLSTRPFKTGT
jgi:hypothetical protein